MGAIPRFIANAMTKSEASERSKVRVLHRPHDIQKFMKYVIGTICICIGFVIIWKSDWLMNNFGRIAWAEEHLGMDGGTRLFYKLLGIIIIVFAFMFMSGAMQSILGAIFGNTTKTLAE